MFVVQAGEKNRYDQRLMQYNFQQRYFYDNLNEFFTIFSIILNISLNEGKC